jgi:hypothetical protein
MVILLIHFRATWNATHSVGVFNSISMKYTKIVRVNVGEMAHFFQKFANYQLTSNV